MKFSNYKKQLFSAFICLLLSLKENESRYRNDFEYITCDFEPCILCPNLNVLFIFLIWENLKIRPQLFKGSKNGVFCNFFKVQYLNELIKYRLHICVKIMLISLSIRCKKIIRLIKYLMFQIVERVGNRTRNLPVWDGNHQITLMNVYKKNYSYNLTPSKVSILVVPVQHGNAVDNPIIFHCWIKVWQHLKINHLAWWNTESIFRQQYIAKVHERTFHLHYFH